MSASSSAVFTHTWPASLGVVAVLAVAVRLGVAAAAVGMETPAAAEPASDSRIHAALIQSLLDGRGFALDGQPVATTPPLYVFSLAGAYALGATPAAVRVLQAFLGAGSCLLLYVVGRRLFDPSTALLASGLLAVHPAASYLAGLHLTENLFLPLMLLLVLQTDQVASGPTSSRALALGALLGLAALTRAVFLLFAPFLLLWALWTWGARSWTAYRVLALAGLGSAVVLLPWTVRNAVVLRTLAPVQSNGPLVFWAANNPHADGGLIWPTRRTWTGLRPPDDGHYGWRDLSIAEENRLYLREAIRWIRDHPGDYVRLLGRKILRLYGFSRSTDGAPLHVPVPVQVFYGALYGLAAAGAWLSWRRQRAIILILLFAFTNLAALLFAGSARYALPMVPSLALWAGFALSNMRRWATEEA